MFKLDWHCILEFSSMGNRFDFESYACRKAVVYSNSITKCMLTMLVRSVLPTREDLPILVLEATYPENQVALTEC